MIAAGICDRGRVRENNEDRYLIFTNQNTALYAVADGMGGHAAGEVASSMALESIRGYVELHKKALEATVTLGESIFSYVEEMLLQANQLVLHASAQKPQYAGMGTTLTLLLAVAGQFWLAHIGDSRAYLLRKEQLLHLSEDHTLVSQLVKTGQITQGQCNDHPQRHILTRALGTDEVAGFDIIAQEFLQGDTLLLCTDGLYGMVADEEIRTMVMQNGNAEETLNKLVALANERGGTDNITAVLVYFS